MKKAPTYKPVRLRADTQWKELSEFAKELSDETGMSVSLPDAISFAVKFTKEQRPKPNAAGTPGGQAQEKGVIT